MIRSYDRDGNVTRELVWGTEGKLVNRPSTLPANLNGGSIDGYLPRNASAVSRSGVLETLTFEAELDSVTTADVTDSLWTDTTIGSQVMVTSGTDPRVSAASEFVFSTPADADDIMLSESGVVFAAAPGTYDEIVEYQFGTADWGAVLAAVAEDALEPGAANTQAPRIGSPDGVQASRLAGGFASLARLPADPCQLEGQLALIAIGYAAVKQGIAVVAAPVPLVNFLAEREAARAIKAALAATGIYALCRWNHRNDP